MNKLKIVHLNAEYCDYLRKYDPRVPYNIKDKQRPFVGVLFNVGKCLYFAPLASPRPKHLKLRNNADLLKIDQGELGVINFNNMVPVYNQNIEYVNINDLENIPIDQLAYVKLLRKQLRWLNRYDNRLYRKSKLLYSKYINNTLNENIYKRCCDFPLLEEKCRIYNSDKN